MRMRKTLSSITLALFPLIWTKSPAAQSFISDPFGVKIDGSYYFSQKSGDSVKLMVSDLSSEGTQSEPFTFKSIGSMVRLEDRLIFAAEQDKGSELYGFSPHGQGRNLQLIKDLVENGSSSPQELTVLGDQVFFLSLIHI